MMRFKLLLVGGGSAFKDRNDVAEMLLVARNKVLAGEQEAVLRDLNGNVVGHFHFEGKE